MKRRLLSLTIMLLLALSFLALIPVAVKTGHASTDTAPVIAPEEGSYVPGETLTIGVTWGYTDSNSYTVRLYASPVDSCLGPFTSSELVAVTSGSNPALSQSGPGPTTFTFTSPNSNLYICASVTDTSLSTQTTLWSGPASYFVSPPLSSYNTNEQNAVSIDLGQVAQLTDYPTGGNAPYFYQWYSGTACSGTVLGTSASYAAEPASLGKNYYSVAVTDSSITPNTICETVTVTVNPTLGGSFTISPCAITAEKPSCEINGQVGSPALTGVVIFSPGTGPWYDVVITSGTEFTCSKDTTVVASLDDINGTEAILTFPEPSTPSSITYYCATLSDSSVGIPTTAPVLGPIQIDISPALSTPTFTITPNANDYGQPPVTVTATVTWSGGTSPYEVVLMSGSSKSCASDDQPVTTLTGGLPTATSGEVAFSADYTLSTVAFTFLSPAATTYYCAVVSDSSSPPSVTFSSTQVFTVESLFAVNAPTLSTNQVEVLSPLYEGNQISATVTWSGGTGPYDVSLYQQQLESGSCGSPGAAYFGPPTLVIATPGSNPQTGVTGTSAVFSFLAPNGGSGTAPYTYCYYATVTDINGLTVGSMSLSSSLVLAAAFTVPTLTLTPTPPLAGGDMTDAGQTESVTATVSFTGGNQPYKVSLLDGPSSSCALDTTLVAVTSGSNPVVGLYAQTTTFVFKSPATTSFYCAKVTDSSVPISTGSTVTGFEWLVNPPPTVSLPPSYGIAAGSSTLITATIVNPGSAPDFLQWFIGPACAPAGAITAAPPATTNPYDTGVISTATTYSVQITDSSSGLPSASACASITITVDNGPLGVAVVNFPSQYAGLVYVANPASSGSPSTSDSVTVIDSDSNTAITTIPLFTTPSTAVDVGDVAGSYPVTPWGIAVDSTHNYAYVTGEVNAPCLPTTLPDTCTVYTTGTTTTGTTPTTLMDTTVSFGATNSLVGQYLEYTGSSPASGQYEPITANTDHSITTAAFPSTPTLAGGDTFDVIQPWAPFGVVMTIQVSTNQEVSVIKVGDNQPEGIALDSFLSHLYVANSGDDTVSVLSTTVPSAPTILTTVPVGPDPEGVAVDQKTDTVYVTDYGSNTVSVMQPRLTPAPAYSTFAVSTVNVGFEPVGVAVNPLNDHVYVTNSGSGTVTVLNGVFYATIATIKVGGMPQGIDIDSAADTAYVANAATNTVSVISLATNAVMASTITVGGGPFGVAVLLNPVDNPTFPALAYVTDSGSNSVYVINIATDQVVATIFVP